MAISYLGNGGTSNLPAFGCFCDFGLQCVIACHLFCVTTLLFVIARSSWSLEIPSYRRLHPVDVMQ